MTDQTEPEEEMAPDIGLHIKLSEDWEIIVDDESGAIGLAHVHGTDRYVLGIGCLGCAGVPDGGTLEEGINVIRNAGRQPGDRLN